MNDIDPKYPYIALIVLQADDYLGHFAAQKFNVAALTDCRITTEIFTKGGAVINNVNHFNFSSMSGQYMSRRDKIAQIVVEMSSAEEYGILDLLMSRSVNKDTTRHSTEGTTALGFLNAYLSAPGDIILFDDPIPGQVHVGKSIVDEGGVNNDLIDHHKNLVKKKLNEK